MYGMRDQHNRKIDYLRISVTDRCNLRCQYCMPEEGIQLLKHKEVLSYEDILKIVHLFVQLGITKIKITGGEPLVRKNIFSLVRKLKEIPEIETVTMTTNGILLKNHLEEVVSSGLDGLNISLDTLDEKKYATLTRGGQLHDVLKSLEYLLDSNFKNIKINTVLIRGFNDDEILSLARLTQHNPIQLRFIELMPIGNGRNFHSYSQDEVKKLLQREFGTPRAVLKKLGNGPANYYHYPNFIGNIGFIDPMNHKFCQDCNRIRLSAQGYLKLCLQYSDGLDLRPFINGEKDEMEARNAIFQSIHRKPLENTFEKEDISFYMNEIGG
ncbi:MAG: GTP 3',8-cyclase MoaA [Tissierellia bacterium]|nr:GTP 3',8-cyclase MoaA [Tissierellia bacterium]